MNSPFLGRGPYRRTAVGQIKNAKERRITRMWKIIVFLLLVIAVLIFVIAAIYPTKEPPASLPENKGPLKGLIGSIVVSEDRKSTLIDDRIVHEGDTIGGVTVVKIYRDSVEFQKEGTERTIRWTQKMGEAPKAYWESKTSK